jgi:hypothetical protein
MEIEFPLNILEESSLILFLMYMNLHVNYLLCLLYLLYFSDFNENLISSIDFFSVGADLLRAYREKV